MKSCEQQARDILEQCGIEDAQSFTAGDVVALANFINEYHCLRKQLDDPLRSIINALGHASEGTVDPERAEDIAKRAMAEASDNREGK